MTETIVETGFLLYFLLNEYWKVSNENKTEYPFFSKRQEEEKIHINTIIHQLFSFLIAIIKFFYFLILMLKKQIFEKIKIKKLQKSILNEKINHKTRNEKTEKMNEVIRILIFFSHFSLFVFRL